jgi:NAD-dependent dihydropyrimidine dehydrogenase PreA subunit
MSLVEMLTDEWRNVRELRHLRIHFDPSICTGTWQCYEVCPIGCWTPDYEGQVVVFDRDCTCVACGACVLQCKPKAIRLEVG